MYADSLKFMLPDKLAMRCVLSAVTCFLVLLLVSGCNKDEKITESPIPPTVTAVTVQPQDCPVTLEKIAQAQSSQEVNIHARVSGFLEKRLYSEGATVTEGQPLFQIDPEPFQVELNQAKAALSKQEVNLKDARLNLKRVRPLAAADAVSKKDLDDAISRVQAESEALEQVRAQVETAKLNLSYTTITSPITGIAGAAQHTDGTFISSQNNLLATVYAVSPIWINFSMSESELLRYRRELAMGSLKAPTNGEFLVEVVLPDGTLFPCTGRITFASPIYNPETGTFLVRSSIDNSHPGGLMPNQFVKVRVKGAFRPRAILLPQRAVHQGARGHYVWVVGKDNLVEQRPIIVGEWHGKDWLIQEGLEVGEQVVVDGAMALSPGTTVTVQSADAAAKS